MEKRPLLPTPISTYFRDLYPSDFFHLSGLGHIESFLKYGIYQFSYPTIIIGTENLILSKICQRKEIQIKGLFQEIHLSKR